MALNKEELNLISKKLLIDYNIERNKLINEDLDKVVLKKKDILLLSKYIQTREHYRELQDEVNDLYRKLSKIKQDVSALGIRNSEQLDLTQLVNSLKKIMIFQKIPEITIDDVKYELLLHQNSDINTIISEFKKKFHPQIVD